MIPLASDAALDAGGHEFTVRDLVPDVPDPLGPVHVTDCVYVPGVSIKPVETEVLLVPPKSPLTIPDPEQAVAFVELYENVEEFPASIVDGENGLSVAVIGETQAEPFQVVLGGWHTVSVTDCCADCPAEL